jgi:hypothetical protein
VLIYIPEHIRHDIDGPDRRSGRRDKFDTTARHAVVSVSALAPAMSTCGQRRGRSGSKRRKRHGGCSRFARRLTRERCCNGRGRSTLLQGGRDRRWGWVENLSPFGLLRRYPGLDLERARTHGRWRRGHVVVWLLWGGGRRTSLCDDLRQSKLKQARPTHAWREGTILQDRILEGHKSER